MSKCPTCSKTVYFAERVSALGRDYHRLCLKCKQCTKALQPGQFAENNGSLYCKPCYSSVIGLKGYGFGNSIDSHVSGGAAGKVQHSAPVSSGGSGGYATRAADPAPAPSGGGGKFCSQCGSRAAGGKFCSECGSAL
ncbi:LIM domain containing protein [Acanthamoeba castellanii str. Neff]|uniref:Cysteine-rich protein 1 n=1 Tax=Acanthamoeba castellanii (strain ATCC 30010 / Neff) TaxID=1257118 RepID=L8HHL9_ACACF|nr:LIM domain containing protein [Acanthamoeba castellanii str. Neff]ELR24198.1 LIM domain containing protein [Acanthamoeba castellanii str. Neff]